MKTSVAIEIAHPPSQIHKDCDQSVWEEDLQVSKSVKWHYTSVASCIDQALGIVLSQTSVLQITGFHWSPSYHIWPNHEPISASPMNRCAYWGMMLWIICYLATRTHTNRSKYKYLKRAASQMALLICGGLCGSGVGFTMILYMQIHNVSEPGPSTCFDLICYVLNCVRALKHGRSRHRLSHVHPRYKALLKSSGSVNKWFITVVLHFL